MDERRIAALALLERVKRHEMESETHELGRLRSEAAQLERLRHDLETRIDEGLNCDDPALRGYIGDFIRSVRSEIDRSQQTLNEIEARAAEMTDKVTEGFREIKSYEILRLDALARRVSEMEAREEAELSNLAQGRWWRARRPE